MTHHVIAYLLYLAIAITITIWVGHTLHKHGRHFVIDAFHGDEERGDAVNHLLLVGFYLVNMGMAALFLHVGKNPETAATLIEYVVTKIGVVLIVLGGMHYFNLKNLDRLRRKGAAHKKAATTGGPGVRVAKPAFQNPIEEHFYR